MSPIPQKRIKDFINNSRWYHTIRFPNGLVSQGVYDHRPKLRYYGFSRSLKNKTVLDIGAADGFFSFEFEKRGAKEIVAIDTHKHDGSIGHADISPAKILNYVKKYQRYQKEKEQFADICKILKIKTPIKILVVKAILNSKVKFRLDSIYNLSNWSKKFDLVFCGDLMEHLKNPLGALENLTAVTKKICIISLSSCPKSTFFMNPPRADKVLLEYHGNKAGGSFFHFYPQTFRQMCLASGFRKVKIYSKFNLKNQKRGAYNHHAVLHCFV